MSVLAGWAYIPYFTLAENNSVTGGFCFVGNPCIVHMTTFDYYVNMIKSITIFDPTSDFDAFLLGPIGGTLLERFDVDTIFNMNNG